MSVKIRFNRDDKEMIDIYSVRGDETILWGVVHVDILDDLEIAAGDLENCETSIYGFALKA